MDEFRLKNEKQFLEIIQISVKKIEIRKNLKKFQLYQPSLNVILTGFV
jgi:hypothetical protein